MLEQELDSLNETGEDSVLSVVVGQLPYMQGVRLCHLVRLVRLLLADAECSLTMLSSLGGVWVGGNGAVGLLGMFHASARVRLCSLDVFGGVFRVEGFDASDDGGSGLGDLSLKVREAWLNVRQVELASSTSDTVHDRLDGSVPHTIG